MMAPRDLRPILWGIIRRIGAKGQMFGVSDVRGCLRFPVKRERVHDYLSALERGGYLERSGYLTSPGPEHEFGPGWTLVRDAGVDAPRLRRDGSEAVLGSGREQCWRAMRILGTFTAAELAATASTQRWTVALGEAQDYCQRLARAHILSRGRPDIGSDWAYTLRPASYSGPKPPQILRYKPAKGDQPKRQKGVYDPNLGIIYWPDGRVEEGVKR